MVLMFPAVSGFWRYLGCEFGWCIQNDVVDFVLRVCVISENIDFFFFGFRASAGE